MIDYTKYTNPGGGAVSDPNSAPLDAVAPVGPPPAAPTGPALTEQQIKGLTPATNPLESLVKFVEGVGSFVQAGVGSVAGTVGEGLGVIAPLGDPTESKIDVSRYQVPPGVGDAQVGEMGTQLLLDLTAEFQKTKGAEGDGDGHVNNTTIFMQLGKWQQQYDPEGFALWQQTLKKAQEATGWAGTNVGSHAGEYLADYIRDTGVAYSNMTSKGLEGWLAEYPELAFGTSGSWGQTVKDTFDHLMLLKNKAEKGAAFIAGNQAGLGGVLGTEDTAAGGFSRTALSSGNAGLGRRLDELLARDPDELTPVELAAVGGWQSGWTVDHVYNFLISHGEGFSSDPGSQILTSIALDPIGVAQLGFAAGSASVRLAVKGQEALAAGGRVEGMYNGIKASIGTTVAEASKGPIGSAFRFVRIAVDPFTILDSSPAALAKVDAYKAAGMVGWMRGIGVGGFKNGQRRAEKWGVSAAFDRLTGLTGMNHLRQWAQSEVVEDLVGKGIVEARRALPQEQLDFLIRNAPKDAVTRIAAHAMRNRAFYLTASEQKSLAERISKALGVHIDETTAAVAEMVPEEMAMWHWVSYTHADQEFMLAMKRIRPEEWTPGMAEKAEDVAIMNPHELDAVSGSGIVRDFRDGVVVQPRAGKAGSIEAKMADGDVAGSQADNIAEGVAGGGTVESGGVISPTPTGGGINLDAMRAAEQAVPEGFTTNPHKVAGGFATPMDAPREGIFHVTVAKDAVRAEGFKTGTTEGLGSAGDATLQGRTSVLTNRARAKTYEERLRLAVEAAQGRIDEAGIRAYFEPLYKKAWGENWEKMLENHSGKPGWVDSPEKAYQLVRHLDAGLVGSSELSSIERAVKLTAPFEALAKVDPAQIDLLELAVRERAAVKQGIDGGELTVLPEDLAVLPKAADAGAAPALQLAQEAATPAATAVKRTKLKRAEAVKHWNRLAEKYTVIESLGRVKYHSQIARKVDALEKAIQRGELHVAFTHDELVNAPKALRDWVAKNTDTAGKPMWRLGFKPSDELATGLIHNGEGLVPRFGAHVDHVSDALAPLKRGGPITDVAGRIIPRAIRESVAGQAVARTRDGLEVAIQTLNDVVDAERIALSVEQGFRSRMRKLGYSDATARAVFKMSRKYAQEGGGFSLAGLDADGWWRATADELAGLVDEPLAKREVFSALLEAAAGDMRLIGYSTHGAQRIRAAFVARGIDKTNKVGAFTVGVYNTLRYTLSPVFYLQTITDAPWFNMLRGVPVDLRGSPIKPGSDLDKIQKILDRIGKTGIYRDVSMDFTDRAYTVTAQANILAALKTAGIEQALDKNIWQRTRAAFTRKSVTGQKAVAGAEGGLRARMTRMQIRNQLLFVKHDIGEYVFDGIRQTDKFVSEMIAKATTNEERLYWQNAYHDIMKPLDDIRARLFNATGKVPTDQEVGLEYLADIIHDATLGEEYTREGYLNYKAINSKGEYIMPSDYGQLKALDIEYGVAALGIPNVRSLKDLRKALTPNLNETAEQALRRERITIGDVHDRLIAEGFHPDHVDRFIARVTFDYEETIQRWTKALGITRKEMVGVEDMIAAEAKRMGMNSEDYLTQVLPLTAKASKGMDGAISKMVQALRKAELGVEDASGLVADRLHPSMKRVLLEEFGLSEWGPRAESALSALARKAGEGTLPASEEVRNALGAYAKIMKDTPALQLNAELKAIIAALPVEGASAYNQTETVLLSTIFRNIRMGQKDAIRLANIQTERTVLERSLNHPLFAMYPSSYMWGKVVPETLRFFAKTPFGIKTGNMALTYAKIKRDIAIQQEYDPTMADLWDKLGKSAVLGFISYATPSMPWEDMAARLPPWLMSAMESRGIDPQNMLERQLYTISPTRWFRDTFESLDEIGGWMKPQEQPDVPSLLPSGNSSEPGAVPPPPSDPNAAPLQGANLSSPVTGAALGPVLQEGLAGLTEALFRA